MSADDDDLGIDLDAWEAPPPPRGIADAVLARLQGTNVNIAVAPVEPARPVRRWWLLGGGLAAAALAASAVAVVMLSERPPASGRGDVDAVQPRRLALGPSIAELDGGTHVSWRRDGYQLTARQARGAATWRVGDDDTLTIDAVLASIEASNASLRVEVQMHPDDDEKRERMKQTIATSAATAAAVALVTVIVYDGAVQVTHAGKATQVAAGTTYQIRGDAPVVIEEEITVAAAPPSEAAAENLERAAIGAGIAAVRDEIGVCGRDYDGQIKLRVEVAPDGSVARVNADPNDAKPVDCMLRAMRGAKFEPTRNGGSFTYPFVFSEGRKRCNADSLAAEGEQAASAGQWSKALVSFDLAVRCEPTARNLQFAFLAACNARVVDQAQRFWRRMSPHMRQATLQFCVRNGITQAQLERGSIRSR